MKISSFFCEVIVSVKALEKQPKRERIAVLFLLCKSISGFFQASKLLKFSSLSWPAAGTFSYLTLLFSSLPAAGTCRLLPASALCIPRREYILYF